MLILLVLLLLPLGQEWRMFRMPLPKTKQILKLLP
jgi:hypothetical protein